MIDPEAWLRSLAPSLSRHKAVIESYLSTARRDDRIAVLVVGCSLGRGVGDGLSDIDALIGVPPDAWASAIAASRDWIVAAGPVVDVNQMLLPERASAGQEYQHSYAQYVNGVELDLVVSRVREDWRRRPDWVVLYDGESSIPREITFSVQSPDDIRRWGYGALTRLGAVAKYVSRGALWEALNCLELARADAWRIWSVAERVADAQYGVTAVFDDPRRPVPTTMSLTVPALDKYALVAAANACRDIVVEAWPRAMAVLDADTEVPPLAEHVRRRLADAAT